VRAHFLSTRLPQHSIRLSVRNTKESETRIRWSAKHGPCKYGDPALHFFVGDLFYKEHDFPSAEPHLLAAGTRDAAKTLANMLFTWSRSGADPGTYASKGVIPFLLAGNILAARTFLSQFLSLLIAARPDILARPGPIALPGGSGEGGGGGVDEVFLTTDTTLNFLQLVIRTCQRAKNPAPQGRQVQEMWVRLCGSYQSRRGLVAQPAYRGVRKCPFSPCPYSLVLIILCRH